MGAVTCRPTARTRGAGARLGAAVVAVVAVVLAASVALIAVPGSAGASPSRTLRWAHWPRVFAETRSGGHVLAPGIVEYTDRIRARGGSYAGWIVRVNLRRPGVTLRVVAAAGRVMSRDAVLSALAARGHADVAVNGDFFQIYATGNPDNEEVVDGRLLQSQRPTGAGYSELMVGPHNRVTIGQATFTGTLRTGDVTEALSGVNTLFGADGAGPGTLAGTHPVLVTHDLGAVVALPRGAVVATLARDGSAWRVRGVASASAVAPPPAPLVRLVGVRAAGRWLAGHLRPGSVVRVRTAAGPRPTVEALGGGPVLVRDGRYADPASDNSYPEAKTGAYLDHSGRFLFLVCFEESWPYQGLTRHQFAGWMAAHGAWTGMMFDDGGSAEMILRTGGVREIVNVPSEGEQRPIADALVVRG
jgi:hypothetical protein